jgi:hypothetical protein
VLANLTKRDATIVHQLGNDLRVTNIHKSTSAHLA